jgi:hypothetical protein
MADSAGSDQHPDLSLLERFMRNEARPAERRWVVRHLLSRCSSCLAVTRRLWALGDPPAAMRLPHLQGGLHDETASPGEASASPPPSRAAARRPEQLSAQGGRAPHLGSRRNVADRLPGRLAGRERLTAASYAEVFQHLAETGRRVAAERSAAPRLVALILASPPADWASLALAEGHVANAADSADSAGAAATAGTAGDTARRFRTPAVCDLLLDRARAAAALDAAFTMRLAELAQAIAERLDPVACGAPVVQALRARAWGCLGDARRRRGDLAGASWALGMAERLAAAPVEPPEQGAAALAAVLGLMPGPHAAMRPEPWVHPESAVGPGAAADSGNAETVANGGVEVSPLGANGPAALASAGAGSRPEAAASMDGLAASLASGALEPVEWAEIVVWKADLVADLGDLGEAERLLARAVALYRFAGEPVLEGGVRMRQGLVRAALADAAGAVELLRTAVDLLDRPSAVAPRQAAEALCHLAVQLQGQLARPPLGSDGAPPPPVAQLPDPAALPGPAAVAPVAPRHRGAEAMQAVARARALYREMSDPVAEARAWRLQGQIEATADRLDEAEATLAGSAAALAELGLGREAALARVELALVLSRGGRAADAARLQLHRRPPLYARDASWVWFSALLVFQCAVAQRAVPALPAIAAAEPRQALAPRATASRPGGGEALFVELARYLAGRPLGFGGPGAPEGPGDFRGPKRLGLVA